MAARVMTRQRPPLPGCPCARRPRGQPHCYQYEVVSDFEAVDDVFARDGLVASSNTLAQLCPVGLRLLAFEDVVIMRVGHDERADRRGDTDDRRHREGCQRDRPVLRHAG
ncbi:MAG: hypothetical protein ACRDKY_03765 [Solirubrobacteraceae bacterium]